MRIRRLIVVGAVTLVTLVVGASPGLAATDIEGDFQDHYTEECVELLVEGGAIEDCHNAPHPLLPDLKELVWGGLAFLLVFVVLAKFAFPALRKAVHAREEKIRDDIEGAESARNAAEEVRVEYERKLAEARVEAGRIIEESRQAADEVRRDLVAQAEGDAAEVRSRAQEDVRLMSERAMADLRSNVAGISIELAEKVVGRNLDEQTQRALIDNFIDQVGSN